MQNFDFAGAFPVVPQGSNGLGDLDPLDVDGLLSECELGAHPSLRFMIAYPYV